MKTKSPRAKMLEWRNNAVLFARERLKVKPEEEQVEILNAISKHQRVSARSGHGIGKSTALSWVGLWWLFTRKDSTVICTAPTFQQLKDILFLEFNKWLNVSGLRGYVTALEAQIGMKGHERTWHILARSSREPENIAGRHAKHLLYLIDEASGINPDIDEAIEGALTEETNKLFMAGNPTQISGPFFNSHTKHRDIYHCLHFNSEDSRRVGKTYCTNMAKKYGRDSDIYRVRVRGDFPKGEPDTLIPLWLVEQALMREDVPYEEGELYEIGVDPARFGNDESVIAVRHNNEILPLYGFYGIDTVRQAGEVAKIVKDIRKKGYTETINVKVDATGIGAGVVDTLKQQEADLLINVIEVNNGAKPQDEDEYYNLGAEVWSEMKVAMDFIKLPKTNRNTGDADDDLVGQMSTRKYKVDPKGRIQLEKKDDMKKRRLKSPDRADAIALALTTYGGSIAFAEDFSINEADYINEVTDV